MNQVVVVSGGSRGLGQAIVGDLLAEGHSVATFSRSPTPFIDDLNAGGGRDDFHYESVDACDFDALKAFTRSVVERFGRIDALVNNAGIAVEGLLALTQAKDIHRVLTLNLESVIHLTQACSRVMLQRRAGSIVNISSLNAVRGHRGVTVYSATKAALDGLTRSLARELGPANIRVNSVAPGYFESEMTHGITDEQRAQIIRRTPLKRLGLPSEIADVVRFFISDHARFVTGQTIVVDGGLTC